MKKFFQSKGFIVSALAVLCVAILGICWFVSRDRTEEFRPNESPPSSCLLYTSPRITRFSTSLDLMERPGTLICFDFQADVLRRYCGSRVRFQTIDFTKFEGRLFP